MKKVPMRTLLAMFALTLTGGAVAQESKIQIKDGPGKDKVMQCLACHSLDYIQMNSHFLDKVGWTAEVKKMINVYKAPISQEDADTIAAYLAQNYGK